MMCTLREEVGALTGILQGTGRGKMGTTVLLEVSGVTLGSSSPALCRLYAVINWGKWIQILYLYFSHGAAWNNLESQETKQNLAAQSCLQTRTKWEESLIWDGLWSAGGGWNGFSFYDKTESLGRGRSVLSFSKMLCSIHFITDQLSKTASDQQKCFLNVYWTYVQCILNMTPLLLHSLLLNKGWNVYNLGSV